MLYMNEYARILDKVTFVFPKYLKVREIMLAVHDVFYKSGLKLLELNLGVQVHAILDDTNDVDVIVLTFSKAQHMETFAAISHRVFSNISPAIPSLALSNTQKDKDVKNKNMINSPEMFVIEEDDIISNNKSSTTT